MEYPIRINKYLAQKNICSRREADGLVRQQKIKINGRIAVLGDMVKEGDTVKVLSNSKKLLYYAFYKPRGIITHSPQKGERGIQDITITPLPVYPVGRLDKDSRGLIVLSNDGRITGKMLDPAFGHEREYEVIVDKPLGKGFCRLMAKGVTLDDNYTTKPCRVRQTGKFSFVIVLTEGKKRQIRRMCLVLGFAVIDLKRVRIMDIMLGDLKPGELRPIAGQQLKGLLKQLKLG